MLSDIVFVPFFCLVFGNAPSSSVLLNGKQGLIDDVEPLLDLKVLVNPSGLF